MPSHPLDPRDKKEFTEAFTLVFEGDIRQFKMNPLNTETPWGVPYACGLGDAFAQRDRLQEQLDQLKD
jgi:hypothetical protein